MVIFITGGASGLGEQTAKDFHALGCKVAVLDINEDNLNRMKNELKISILCIKCDVTKEEEVKGAVEETVITFGTIHVAINCAGGGRFVPTLS